MSLNRTASLKASNTTFGPSVSTGFSPFIEPNGFSPFIEPNGFSPFIEPNG